MDGRHIFKNGLKTARLGSIIFVQIVRRCKQSNT